MTAAAGVSRGIPGAFPRIPADHTSPAARTVRPAVAHTTIGRTSGEATRAHADHAYDSNTAMSVSRCAASITIAGRQIVAAHQVEQAALEQRRPSIRLRAPRASSRGGAHPGRGPAVARRRQARCGEGSPELVARQVRPQAEAGLGLL